MRMTVVPVPCTPFAPLKLDTRMSPAASFPPVGKPAGTTATPYGFDSAGPVGGTVEKPKMLPFNKVAETPASNAESFVAESFTPESLTPESGAPESLLGLPPSLPGSGPPPSEEYVEDELHPIETTAPRSEIR
jgi:hypothetical protein